MHCCRSSQVDVEQRNEIPEAVFSRQPEDQPRVEIRGQRWRRPIDPDRRIAVSAGKLVHRCACTEMPVSRGGEVGIHSPHCRSRHQVVVGLRDRSGGQLSDRKTRGHGKSIAQVKVWRERLTQHTRASRQVLERPVECRGARILDALPSELETKSLQGNVCLRNQRQRDQRRRYQLPCRHPPDPACQVGQLEQTEAAQGDDRRHDRRGNLFEVRLEKTPGQSA